MVDAGKDKVRHAVQKTEQGQLDAVGGCAAAGPGLHPLGEEVIGPLGTEGGLEGESVTGGGALLVGADHRHLVAAADGLRRQGLDPLSEDAVIIADQDSQRRHGWSGGDGSQRVIRDHLGRAAYSPRERPMSVRP